MNIGGRGKWVAELKRIGLLYACLTGEIMFCALVYTCLIVYGHVSGDMAFLLTLPVAVGVSIGSIWFLYGRKR